MLPAHSHKLEISQYPVYMPAKTPPALHVHQGVLGNGHGTTGVVSPFLAANKPGWMKKNKNKRVQHGARNILLILLFHLSTSDNVVSVRSVFGKSAHKARSGTSWTHGCHCETAPRITFNTVVLRMKGRPR